MEPFTAKGTWWVPGEKRNRSATGTITYSPLTAGTLEVYGKRLDGTSVIVPVLYGDTERGPITLLDCIFETASMHAGNDSAGQLFSCEVVIVGAHVRQDSVFGQAIVRVTYLDEWARIGSIEPLGDLRNGHPDAGQGFYYKKAPGSSAILSDGSQITLGATEKGSLGATEATIGRIHHFDVHTKEPKPLDALIDDYVRPFVDLLTLLVDRPSSLLSLQIAKRPRSKKQLLTPYDYYDVGLRTSKDPTVETSLPLPTQIIRSDEFRFTDQIPMWFDLAAKLGGIRGLVFGLRYTSEMSVENRYLNAATAAEALHRATFKSKRAGIDLKNKATEDWLAQYPENERNLIKTRMSQYINDPSLADRLTELVSKADAAFSDIVPDSPEWVKIVKNVRNDLTHQEGVPKVRVSSRQMYVLAESTALLVTICFLVDLGFTPEDLKDRLLRPLRIRALKSEVRAILPSSAE